MTRHRIAVTLAIVAGTAIAALASPQSNPGSRTPDPGSRVPTFTKDIAPLIYDRCGTCHRPDGPAPFSLLTYEAVRQRATLIADVTSRRIMPPWKADADSGEFIGQKHLSDADIALIKQWIDGGRVEGNPADLPRMPDWPAGWQLGTPDLVVTMPQSYALAADGTDVFRTFVISIPIADTKYVRGVEFRPSNPRVVHHANIRIDRTAASRELDAVDAAPGYDGAMAHSAQFPDGHFLAWTPGQVAPLLPAGLAWRLEPGTDLVFQLHLQPSGRPEPVGVSIGFFFGSDPPARTPSMLRLTREDIDIAPGDAGYTVTDSITLPVDVEIQALQPHAHTRARDISGIAALPDGRTVPLVHIADWDFRWQHVYRYVKPIALPRGSTVTMRYTYDNSADNIRNPVRPPARVHYGWQTLDEMGELYVQVLTRSDADRAVLDRAIERKDIAADIVGYERLMARNAPGAGALHDDLAFLYLELRDYDKAIAQFEAAVQVRPDAAFSHFNLGTALMMAGQWQRAEQPYREAVRLDPAYAVAHDHLGKVLVELRRPDEALREYREAVRLAPSNAAAHNNLGVMLLQQGQVDDARAQFEEALRLDPSSADARANLDYVLRLR